jgi:hypothetical protein
MHTENTFICQAGSNIGCGFVQGEAKPGERATWLSQVRATLSCALAVGPDASSATCSSHNRTMASKDKPARPEEEEEDVVNDEYAGPCAQSQ